MSQALSVMLIHGDERERGELRAALEAIPAVKVVAERPDLRAGLALARQVAPTILVVELASQGAETLSAIAHHKLDHPDVAVFLLTESLDPDTLLSALRAGAQEVLRRPLDRVALCEAVERVARQTARKSGGSSPRLVITVFSNKGGCGVTTIAANLAVSLRQMTERETVLFDLDYQSGNAALALGLAPVHSLQDVLAAPRIDSATLQSGLLRHASGLHVLAQPETLEHLEDLTPAQVASVLEMLYGTFELIVVDTPHVFNPITLEIFDRSSTILLLTELTVPSVRAAHRSLEIFHRLHYTTGLDRVRLVVNRHNGHSTVTSGEVSQSLRFPIFHRIANDYAAVSRALDVGKAVCDEPGTSPTARDIAGLARKLVDGVYQEQTKEPAVVSRPGRLRLFRRG